MSAPAEWEDRGWYDCAGPTSARPIVLVHGVEVSRRMWLPQLEGLGDAYRVLAPDLPAHGALADLPFTMDGSIERVVELIDREAQGRALLVGLSLGGYITIELAARYPNKVAGAVLSGCSSVPRGPVTWPHRLYAGTLCALPPRSLHWARAAVFRAFWPQCAEAVIKAGFFPRALRPAARELVGRDVLAPLSAYPGPVLLLNGQHDWLFRRSEGEYLSAARNARLVVIPGGDHGCNMGRPQEFNAAVRDFAGALGW
jgi:pimeloyl-ACP methyl ester carboxylesterase